MVDLKDVSHARRFEEVGGYGPGFEAPRPPAERGTPASLSPCGCGCGYGKGNARQCNARQGNAMQGKVMQSNAMQCKAW